MTVGDDPLDRLAVLVDSSEFALAFAWGAVLLTALPACLVCSLGFHGKGAFHLAAGFAFVGLVVGLVSALKVLDSFARLRGAIAR